MIVESVRLFPRTSSVDDWVIFPRIAMVFDISLTGYCPEMESGEEYQTVFVFIRVFSTEGIDLQLTKQVIRKTAKKIQANLMSFKRFNQPFLNRLFAGRATQIRSI